MANYRDEPVEFDCEVKHETERAYIVVIEDEEYSIPKSMSHYTPQSLDKVSGVIEMPTWLAEEKGLA